MTIRRLLSSCTSGLPALLSDDYFPSDYAWLDLKDPKIDIIYAPYETYDDGLLGIKATYGAAILVRNHQESEKLKLFQRYVADIQDALPIDAQDRPSVRGLATPMEVMDSPFRAGDLRHGYQVVADNLPNDPKIHREKGTRRSSSKTFWMPVSMKLFCPTALQVMDPAQARLASGEGYLAFVMMHEICHGLGPAFAHTPQGKRNINESIGPGASSLEESKADIVGMFALDWLIGHGGFARSPPAGILRLVRCRHLPQRALWDGRVPCPRRDDGIQLSGGARRNHS